MWLSFDEGRAFEVHFAMRQRYAFLALVLVLGLFLIAPGFQESYRSEFDPVPADDGGSSENFIACAAQPCPDPFGPSNETGP